MRIMISYTREDQDSVGRLVEGLTRLGHQTWYDRSLHSGENWWNAILRTIVESDAVLLSISPSFLQSNACTAEWKWAVAVRRPLLAVMVAPVGHSVLPVELAGLHILDYTRPTEATAFDLVRSISALPPAPPPPHSLPPAPPVPLSYLNAMRDQISGPALDLNGQLSVVSRLTDGMRSGDADERQGARELLLAFAQRGQLYEQPAQLARAALADGPSERAEPPLQPQPWRGNQGNPPPEHQPRTPPKRGASKPTKVLAWIGGVMLVLIALGIAGSISGSGSGSGSSSGSSGSSGGSGSSGSSGGTPSQLTVCLWDQSGHPHPHLFDSTTGQPVLQADGNLTAC